MLNPSNSLIKMMTNAAFPPRCALCGTLQDSPVCDGCRSEFKEIEPHLRLESGDLAATAVAFEYTGRAAQAVRRLKYDRVTPLAPWMANEMRSLVQKCGLSAVDLIVPVPIHWSRLCERGFNQSELLAANLGEASTALLRFRRTRPQVGLDLEQRLENLKGAFRAKEGIAGKTVLLVDDVITSGGTVRACAAALRAAEAISVSAVAFCGAEVDSHRE